MSADNWTRCPRCLQTAYSTSASRRKAAEDAYGKVSSEEYLRFLALANEDLSINVTLREDYHVGIIAAKDIFCISYSASCKECDFTLTYSREEKLNEVHS